MSKGRKGKGGGSKRARTADEHPVDTPPHPQPILGRVQLRSDGSGVLVPSPR